MVPRPLGFRRLGDREVGNRHSTDRGDPNLLLFLDLPCLLPSVLF